jgi:hypothetical protein
MVLVNYQTSCYTFNRKVGCIHAGSIGVAKIWKNLLLTLIVDYCWRWLKLDFDLTK